jgi:hypothetical protein
MNALDKFTKLLALQPDEIAYLKQYVAAQYLTYAGHAAGAGLFPAEQKKLAWLDALDKTLAAPLPTPVVSIKKMRKSGDEADYFVSIRVGDRDVTPHRFTEEYKAAYHVALYDWLLNGGDEPDLMAFGPEDWPAVKMIEVAEGGTWLVWRHLNPGDQVLVGNFPDQVSAEKLVERLNAADGPGYKNVEAVFVPFDEQVL